MPLTQLDVQLGIKKQTNFTTPATVDQFPEFVSETLDRQVTFIQSKGLRAGSRVARSARRLVASDGAGGGVVLEAPLKGLGVWLEAAFGTVSNTAVPSASGAFQQVHTPSTGDPINTYTIQKGIPVQGAAAASPMTFNGAWCKSITFDAKAGEVLTVTTDWGAKEVVTNTALAPASYPTGNDVFTYCHGAITLGGTLTKPSTTALASTTGTAAANVVDFSLTFDQGLDDGGRTLGGACKVSRVPLLGMASISGTMTVEYADNVLRDAYLAQTDLALVLNFQHTTTIGTGTPVPAYLQIVVPVIRLDGELPKVDGSTPVKMSMGFTGLDGLASATSPIYVVYRTTDTTP